jgi:hypothetical protein
MDMSLFFTNTPMPETDKLYQLENVPDHRAVKVIFTKFTNKFASFKICKVENNKLYITDKTYRKKLFKLSSSAYQDGTYIFYTNDEYLMMFADLEEDNRQYEYGGNYDYEEL